MAEITTARLVPAHAADLQTSGLSLETILDSGIYSASAAEASAILGYGVGSGMAIPYPVNGPGPPFVRIKLDQAGPDGKRYRTRKGGGNRLYIPRLVSPERLADVSVPVYIVEGEKKCLKANQEGLLCVGLAGVRNWRTSTPDGPTAPLPELDAIPFTDRIVYLVFDADPKPTTVADVRRAEAALAAELARRRAQVFAIRLPLKPDGTKCGLDDYLVDHSVEAFCSLEPVPLGPAKVEFPRYDAAEAEAWDFPPPAFIIDVLMPVLGTLWVGGLPKRGKSLFVLVLALAIACRRDRACAHFAVRAAPKILYITREDGGPRLKDRIRDILSAWPERPASGALHFIIKPRIDLMDAAHVAFLRETCQREQRTVLVLDTWTTLSPSADPIGTKDQTVLAAIVVQLAEDIGGLVIVVDHSRKNRPDGGILTSSDIFGPAQKWAAAEHIIMLDHAGADETRWELFIEGKDSDSARFLLAKSARGSGIEKLVYAGDVERLGNDQREIGHANRTAVLTALTALDGPDGWVTAEAVAQKAGEQGTELTPGTIQRHLKALETRQLVEAIGKGKARRYRRAKESRQVPSAEIAPAEEEFPYGTSN